ncbi:hypothetical protein BU23DRAFT_567730 [Bimuria novae-zelandiae CBS 107.79]|uniref:Secreted protein n=1 Tax=Bimuria novae-zelandiae CBS 107.79 TaxID=1447943 RepID=A0A6A5VBN6_9PLEO|nr:hypothetical protein BU23DRAFT_567730 [Bimuria novae-zelandiae CBS 107.79]
MGSRTLLTFFFVLLAASPGELNITGSGVDFSNPDVPDLVANVNKSAVVLPDGTILKADELSMAGVSALPGGKLRLTMSTERVHVGNPVFSPIVFGVSKAMMSLCTVSKIPGSICDRSKVTIDKIRTSGGGDGFLDVHVESDYIPDASVGYTDPTMLFTLFMAQIYEAFSASVKCHQNRYQNIVYHCNHNLPCERVTCVEMANAAAWYQIGIHDLPDGTFPHLRVSFTYRGKAPVEAQFDCKGSQSKVWENLGERRTYYYARAANASLQAEVRCGDKSGLVEGLPTGSCKFTGEPLTCKLVTDCEERKSRAIMNEETVTREILEVHG